MRWSSLQRFLTDADVFIEHHQSLTERLQCLLFQLDLLHTAIPAASKYVTDTQTDRQTDTQTNRETDRETDKQTERQMDGMPPVPAASTGSPRRTILYRIVFCSTICLELSPRIRSEL